MKTLRIGRQDHERLLFFVLGYERPYSGEFYDDNWLKARVEITVGSFSGSFDLSLTTQDFVSFLRQLDRLYQTLKGEAKFQTMESQMEFLLVCNARGGIEVSGYAIDRASDGNRLEFQFCIDQSYLVSTLRELREITAEFPIRKG